MDTSNHRHSSPLRGFTLVELIVIIVIIALLVMILLPVFAQSREKARSSACESNLKQIALGLIGYSQDYDGQLPPAWIGYNAINPAVSISFPGTARWMDVEQPYVKSTKIFTCPDSQSRYTPVPPDRIVSDTDPATGQPYVNENGGYSMNVTYYSDALAHPPTPVFDQPGNGRRSLSNIADPAGTAYIFDFYNGTASFQCTWGGAGGQGQPKIDNNAHPRTLGGGGWLTELHNGRLNVEFCDGHVKSVDLDFLTQPGKIVEDGVPDYCHFTIENDCP